MRSPDRIYWRALYDSGSGSWGRLGDNARRADEKFRALDEQRRLFAADQPDDVARKHATHYPDDPSVSGWVWTTRNRGSFWRSPRFAVYTDEARAIEATKPDEPLFGIHPGGRTTESLRGPWHTIRGYFEDTERWGYRAGHGTADPRHPSRQDVR